MKTRRNNKRPRKHGRKTRSKRQRGGDDATNLLKASWDGETETVVMLLEKGTDVNDADIDGMTALMMASENGHKDVVEILLKEEGINVNLWNNEGETALILASEYGHTEIVKMLLNAGAHVNMVEENDENMMDMDEDEDQDAKTALMMASEFGHTEIVKILLKAGADVNAVANDGYDTAFNLANKRGHDNIVELLIRKGATIPEGNQYQELRNKKEEIIKGKLAIMNVASKKMRINPKELPRFMTDFMGGKRKTRKSKRKTRKNRKTRKTRSKKQRGGGAQEENLFTAVKYNNLDKAREALDEGADVNALTNVRYQVGNTALILASRYPYPEMVEMLLAAGADVNAKDNHGFTALMRSNESEIVEMLLAAGADVNAKNNHGETALIMASSYDAKPEVVRILLENGADVNAKSNDGKTAISWARSIRATSEDPRKKVTYWEIEKLLKQYIFAPTLPTHLERQQNRLNVGRVMDSKKMPGDLTHKIITEHFGGKRKTRKSKPKKRNRRSRKRAGANGDDSYDEGETTRESISQDEPFHVDGIDAIPLANEVHELEMANLDDSWASHSSIDPNGTFINPYESDESLDLTPN